MKNNVFIGHLTLFSCLVIILFHSCAPAYIPNTINTPMLSNKGELQVALNSGVSGFDPQVSFAISDHVGIMANASFDNQTNDSTDNFHRHAFMEAGAGYYTHLGNSGRFEVYGGMGLGNTQGQYNGIWWVSNANARLMRFFIQPGIGFSTPYADGGIATRMVAVNLHQDEYTSTGLFFEPVLSARLGYKYVKLFIQGGLSFPLNSDQVEFEYQPLIFSVGLHINLFRDY
jgi:hypothetical protein